MLAGLSFGHLATDLSQGAIPALLPLFKTRYHLSYTDVGLVVLMSNISSSVIQPAFGVLSDRLGMRWLMPLGVLTAGAGMVLAVLAPHYGTMLAMVFLSGVGVAAFHPEGYKFAGRLSGPRRATGMSYFSVGGNIGYGFGPAAASVAIHVAGRYGMAYILAFSIPAAVLLWRTTAPRSLEDPAQAGPEPPRRAPASARPRVAASAVVLTLLVAFVVLRSWISSGISSFIPLYFVGVRRMDPRLAAALVSVFLGAGGAGTLLGGLAADRWGPRRILVLSMAVLPPLLWTLPRASGIWVVLIALAAGMAVVSTFAVAMVMAQAVLPDRIGLTSGLIIGFAVGMGGIGVTLLGALADRWGLLSAMDLTALLPAAALGIALLLPPDRHGEHPAEAGSQGSLEQRGAVSAEMQTGGR
jgi:FSR family fosmidomycin resistance protein-like MFS transporter